MKLDELQSVQSRERQTDQLQQLRSTFYEEAGKFVAQLREERDRAAERADDPFDAPEVNRLTNDIKTAEQTVEAVYERRVGKIVKMASLAAADMPTEDGGLTQEEETLFETMVEAIQQNRQHVLDVAAGEAPTGAVGDGESGASETSDTTDSPGSSEPTPSGSESPDPTPSGSESPDPTPPTTDADPSVDAADIMGGGDGTASAGDGTPTPDDSVADADPTESLDRPAEEALSAVEDGAGPESSEREPAQSDEGSEPPGGDVDRKTVRITDEVGEIFGVDQRSYDLSTNDVVTLPADNADPLVERDAAEPLE